MNKGTKKEARPDFRETVSFKTALLGLVLILGYGCAAPRPVAVTELPAAEGEQLVASVKAHAFRYHSLNGLARVRGEIDDRSFSFTQGILAVSPDRLRLETLSPFGQPLLIVTTDGQVVAAMSPSRNQFWEGPVSADNIRTFLRLPMELDDLVGVLLYRIPVGSYTQLKAEYLSDGQYRVTLAGPDRRTQLLYFDGESRLIGVDWYDGENLQSRVEFADFREANGFPGGLSIKMPSLGHEIHLTYSDIKINPVVPESRFRLEPLPGMSVRSFPDFGGGGLLETGD